MGVRGPTRAATRRRGEADTGYHRWSERYERPLGDLFEVQDEIVERLTANLLSRLPRKGAPPSIPRTTDRAAYDAYLRGRHLNRWFDPQSVAKAEVAFREALARDPAFAPPHAALAEVLILQAVAFGVAPPTALMPRAREAAERALDLDPELPEASLARGLVRSFHDWDFPGARQDRSGRRG